MRRRLGSLVYALLAAFAVLLLAERFVVWHFDPLDANPAGKVVLYSAQWCGFCAQIRECFVTSRVPFEERDVERSLRASAEWWALKVPGVPATLIGKELIYGFQTRKLTEALDRSGIKVSCWDAS
ncbi:MAG TPA: glutaredoxin domain-containing protein [Gammaproteobacteria bacterium]